MKYWHSSVRTAALVATAVFAFPHALPAQVIAGRVTDDRTLQPAVDYIVRLVQTSDTGIVVLDETSTDPKGQFMVVAPSAGSYLLSFGRTAPRVHRFTVDVQAGAAPAPKDFSLPIQRESDTRPYVDVDRSASRSPSCPETRGVEPRLSSLPHFRLPDSRIQLGRSARERSIATESSRYPANTSLPALD